MDNKSEHSVLGYNSTWHENDSFTVKLEKIIQAAISVIIFIIDICH